MENASTTAGLSVGRTARMVTRAPFLSVWLLVNALVSVMAAIPGIRAKTLALWGKRRRASNRPVFAPLAVWCLSEHSDRGGGRDSRRKAPRTRRLH